MLDINVAKKLLENVNGASFVGIDTETVVALTGGKGNPQKGRVTKVVTGSSVMVFQNKNANGYENMVERRLAAEGKDSKSFELGPRKWGTRITNTPFIEHDKDGTTKHYLEVIFLNAGEVNYLLDGKPIDKVDVIGLPKPRPSGQGGLENQVIIRSYALDSIRAIRIDKTEYKF